MIGTILVLGPSGAGKTSSTYSLAKHMQEEVFFINTERKDLPYPADFKHKARPKTSKEILNVYDQLILKGKSQGIRVAICDSLSSYMDISLAESRSIFTGYDIWSSYNDKLGQIFIRQKDLADTGIHSVMIAHDEPVLDEGGSLIERSTKTKGKEWKGVVEKEFNVVLWSQAIPIEGTDQVEYQFMTNTNGKIPAKSPLDMLSKVMPNDLYTVIKALDNYGKKA